MPRAQEIIVDGKIPHMAMDAATMIIDEGARRAKDIDHKERALTLKLRELGGLIRAAGDICVSEEGKLIEKRHVKEALNMYLPVEEKIKKYYGNFGAAVSSESTDSQKQSEYFSNYHNYRDDRSYQ